MTESDPSEDFEMEEEEEEEVEEDDEVTDEETEDLEAEMPDGSVVSVGVKTSSDKFRSKDIVRTVESSNGSITILIDKEKLEEDLEMFSDTDSLGGSLTARQRSRKGSASAELLALPMKRSSKKRTQDEETQLKRSENARRRKLQQKKQDDEEKQAVMDKLLNKSDVGHKTADKVKRIRKLKRKTRTKIGSAQPQYDFYRYNARYDSKKQCLELRLGIPSGGDTIREIIVKPRREYCTHCSNPRKYLCSKSNVPLCSLKCYNIQQNAR